jgi:quercetin dioxygenase-like cupin family protein
MLAMSTNDLALTEIWLSSDPDNARLRVDFPINNSVGTESTAVVYFEIEPGDYLPTHTDSAEEILYIVQGTARATVGDEEGIVRAGDLAVIPALVPHGVANVGEDTVKVVGFFSDSYISSVFEDALEPIGSANPEMGVARERV